MIGDGGPCSSDPWKKSEQDFYVWKDVWGKAQKKVSLKK